MGTEKGKSKIVKIALLCLLGAVLCVSAYMVVTQLLDRQHSAETFEKLRRQFVRPSETYLPEGATADPMPKPGEDIGSDGNWEEHLLECYAGFKEENPDYYGWLSAPDTAIDYPVMHTPSDPERYLRRAFDGSYAISGVPFLDGACYENCGNLIIYGHYMEDGSMFTDLLKYADQSFWQDHPTIRFDTPEEIAEYEVMAAFYAKVYYADDSGVFRYYRYTDVSDPDVFNEYIAQVRAAALYNTGVGAEPGDRLITLSTCDYHTENGRFVVVARKMTR